MPDTGLGQGTQVEAGSIVTFDNLFTSLSLLDELIELGIGALGTLRQNRFHDAPVANKTTLAKKPRGSYDFATDGKNLVVSPLDNKVVTCATNHVICNPVSTAQRWSKSAKTRVDVPIPKPLGSPIYDVHKKRPIFLPPYPTIRKNEQQTCLETIESRSM